MLFSSFLNLGRLDFLSLMTRMYSAIPNAATTGPTSAPGPAHLAPAPATRPAKRPAAAPTAAVTERNTINSKMFMTSAHLTIQAQRPGPRDATIATVMRWPGSLQRMVRRFVLVHVRSKLGKPLSDAAARSRTEYK